MRNVLIIDYPGMNVGGIENILSLWMEYALRQGYRVVWITTSVQEQQSCFKITSDDRIEVRYVTKTIFGPCYPRILVRSGEHATMVTCEPLQYVLSHSAVECEKGSWLDHLLILPHDRGNMYYPEKFFKGNWFKAKVWNWCKEIAAVLSESDCVLGFNEKHFTAFCSNYEININSNKQKTLPAQTPVSCIKAEDFADRAKLRSDNFIVTTCARFDFPHKGYLIGLVNNFASLTEGCGKATLQIVGYGDGEADLKSEIDKLPIEARASIRLLGKLSPDKLREVYRRSHLAIGVAGAISLAAGQGTPSIIAREYTYNLEGYGYYCVGNTDTIRTVQGHDLKDEVRNAMRMTDDEYVELCIRTIDAAKSKGDVDQGFIFRQATHLRSLPFDFNTIAQCRLLYFLTYYKRRIRGVYGY